MTNAQLQHLLKWPIRYVAIHNAATRKAFTNPRTRRIEPRSIALEVAKAEQWLAKAKRAVIKRKAVT